MKEHILNVTEETGPLIKEIRSELKITQDELANFTGLSRIGVVKLEKGENDIKLSSLLKIAKLLGYDIVLRKRGHK